MAKTKKERIQAVTLADLADAGIITPGKTKFVASYLGNPVTASFTKDGLVRVNGENYNSLSTAARRAQAALGNENPNVNGFRFFSVKTSDGLIPVAELREQALDKGKAKAKAATASAPAEA